MIMRRKFEVSYAIVVLGLLCMPGVLSYLIVTPSNVAAVSTNSATLSCTSSLGSSSISWSTATTVLVKNCQVNPAATSQLTTETTSTGQCNLVLLNTTQADAIYYTCTDGDFTSPSIWMAYLTILDGEPQCQSNGTDYVLQNELVTMSCDVTFVSPDITTTASMNWTCSPCDSQSPISSVSGVSRYTSSSACVFAELPTVPTCICTTQFTAPAASPPGSATNAPTYLYTWSSPSDVLVSYCPIVSISPPDPSSVYQYTSLTCTADAYPPVPIANYVITSTDGNGVETGESFNVTTIGDFSISCTATNYLLGGTNMPCSTTASVTGTSYASYCPENVTISAPSVNVTAGDTLTCTAAANPAVATYQWTGVSAGVDLSYTGQSFVLLYGGPYNITCTATNYLYGDVNNPCSASTQITGLAESLAMTTTTTVAPTTTSPPASATMTTTTRAPTTTTPSVRSRQGLNRCFQLELAHQNKFYVLDSEYAKCRRLFRKLQNAFPNLFSRLN